MEQSVRPLTPAELIEQVDRHLQTLHYTEETMRHYRNVWNGLKTFVDEREISAFSVEAGQAFIREHYGCSIDMDKPASSFNRTVFRAIEVLSEFQSHGIVFRRRMTKDDIYPKQFEALFRAYCAACEARGLTPRTLRQISIHCRRFARYLDYRQIPYFSEISVSDIQNFVLTMAPYAKRTIAYSMYVLRSLLTYAYENGYHERNLSSACPTVKYNSKSAIPSAFSEEEVCALLSAVDRGNPIGKRDYAILMLAAHLGLRVGEIRNLCFEHLKWETSRVEFVQPKTQKLLSLPLLQDVGWAIIDYIQYGRPPQSNSKYIFVRHQAPYDEFGTEDNLHQIMVKYIRLANITVPKGKRYGIHSLRHSLASALLEKNTPMPVISEIMNHACTETTNLYLKIDFPHLKECALEVDFNE